MKRICLPLLAALCLSTAPTVSAKGYLKFKGLTPNDTVILVSTPMQTFVAQSAEQANAAARESSTAVPKNGELTVTFDGKSTDTQVVQFLSGKRQYIDLYLQPNEKTVLTIDSQTGLCTATKGASELTTKIVDFYNTRTTKINKFYSAETTDSLRRQIRNEITDDVLTAIRTNLDNSMGVYALMQAPTQSAMDYIDQLSGEALTGPMAPLLEAHRAKIEEARKQEAEREKSRLHVGDLAPDFTLPDAEGHEVRFSSLRGRWVMLDFWGTWCGWCVKGIPQMAQEYDRLKDKVEFVSVDCGDSHDKWAAAIAKHGMTWVNLWCDPEIKEQVASKYRVEGFPTKLIIDPEGKIANITVGEDPEFYKQFDELLK